MTDKLGLYNGALGHLESRRIRTLTENREPRRVLDDYWDGAVRFCLERHFWNFMYRTVQLDASASVTPAFGYSYAFAIPSDRVRTRVTSASETLVPPLLEVREEAGLLYANVTPLFLQYNSSAVQYGMDLSLWPQSFAEFVELRLAVKGCKRITGSEELLTGPRGLIKRESDARKVAASICAMNDPVQFPPPGKWVTSRFGGRGSDNPGSSLIG